MIHVDWKITPFGCKIVYTLILPSMNFWKIHPKRESERELKHTPPEVIPKHILSGQIVVLIPSMRTHTPKDKERARRECEEDNPTFADMIALQVYALASLDRHCLCHKSM